LPSGADPLDQNTADPRAYTDALNALSFLPTNFVQWHGNYPMLQKTVELNSMAAELRMQHGRR
jgi:hypothetical protein